MIMTAKNETSPVKNRLYRKITSPVFSRFLSLGCSDRNQIGIVVGTHLVGNDHDGEKRDQPGEEQAVQEDHQPGFFQVLKLGVFRSQSDWHSSRDAPCRE